MSYNVGGRTMTVEDLDYDAVWRAVSGWPTERRVTLAHALIDSLRSPPDRPRPKPSLDELVGSARGEGPAPTDEMVEQWIDEHRMQKYGG